MGNEPVINSHVYLSRERFLAEDLPFEAKCLFCYLSLYRHSEVGPTVRKTCYDLGITEKRYAKIKKDFLAYCYKHLNDECKKEAVVQS